MDIGFNTKIEDLEKNDKNKLIASSCRDILEEYLTENQHLDIECNTRLIIKK